MNAIDRLGDAIREIACDMATDGKRCIRLTVVIGTLEATYELALVRARTKPKPCRTRRAAAAHPARRS